MLPGKPDFLSELAQNLMHSHTPMMLQIKFGCDRSAGCGDIHVCKFGRIDTRTPAPWVYYKLTL